MSGVDFLHRNGVNFYLNIDSIQQGAGYSIEIAANLPLGTATLLGFAAEIAAGTRVHAGNEHEAGLILCLILHPGHGNYPILQGLPQGFQGGTAELRQFIEKQHPYTTVSSLHEPFPPNVSANATSILTPLRFYPIW